MRFSSTTLQEDNVTIDISADSPAAAGVWLLRHVIAEVIPSYEEVDALIRFPAVKLIDLVSGLWERDDCSYANRFLIGELLCLNLRYDGQISEAESFTESLKESVGSFQDISSSLNSGPENMSKRTAPQFCRTKLLGLPVYSDDTVFLVGAVLNSLQKGLIKGVDKILSRGDKIDELVEKSNALQFKPIYKEDSSKCAVS